MSAHPIIGPTDLPPGDVSLRCLDCGHEYKAARVEYLCPECDGDVALAPMAQQALA